LDSNCNLDLLADDQIKVKVQILATALLT